MKTAFLAVGLMVAWTPPTFAETGVTEKEILIGSCAPLSGVNRDLGQAELSGASAYVDYVNKEKGGVHGRRIRVVSYDDRYEVDEAIVCFSRLIQDGVFAAAFFSGAPTGVKYVGMAEANKLPIVGMVSGAKFLYEPFKRYILNMRATFLDETAAETERLWTDLGARKIGVIYQNDAFGAAGLEGVHSVLGKRKAAPTVLAAVERNSMDVGAAVEKVKAAEPEVVFLFLTYGPAAEVVKKAAAIGWRPRFILMAGRESFLREAGQAAEGTVWAQLLPPTDDVRRPSVALFQRLIKRSPDAKADPKTMEGFIHAMVLVEGLRRAGKNPTREKLIDAVESIRNEDLGIGPDFKFQFGPTNHQGFKTMHFVVVRGGKPVPFSDWKELRKNSR